MKYCPNCLKECTECPYGGYACEPCGVLQYTTSITLDTPDKEKSRTYKMKKYLRKITHYEVRCEDYDSIIDDIKKILLD